jgi:hypothetical protein
MRQSIHTSIHPYIHSSIHPFIHPFIHSSIHTSIHQSIHSPTHPSTDSIRYFIAIQYGTSVAVSPDGQAGKLIDAFVCHATSNACMQTCAHSCMHVAMRHVGVRVCVCGKHVRGTSNTGHVTRGERECGACMTVRAVELCASVCACTLSS